MLNNLPFGKTKVTVRATDASGCWQEETVSLDVVRLRPWWQRWWAICLFLLILTMPFLGMWVTGVRVRKLHLIRKQHEDLAISRVATQSTEEILADRDKQFLADAKALIEKNISNPEYNVEALAADLCMSRSNLYRRMQPLTGLSPIEFVRDIRLKSAWQLLHDDPKLTASALATKVGFTSAGYFSKCFKEKFGMMPSKVKNGINGEN